MTRSNRIQIGAGIGLAVLFLAAYFASPILALHSLTAAAKAGDRAKLERGIDFLAVRESLKAQLKAAMTRSIDEDQSLRDNPFAALGQLLLGGVVDKVVDTYATPDAIANMVATNRAPSNLTAAPAAPSQPATSTVEQAAPAPLAAPAPEAKDKPKSEASYAYQDLNHFRATYRDANDAPGDEFGLLLERRGLFKWKLVRIELPTNIGR